MPKAKRIQFQTTINAPVEVVWELMLGDEGYRRWTKVFTDGSYYEGSWSQGSRMKFLAPSGDGMVSEVAEYRSHELVSIRHIGFIIDGVEDTESDAVRAWAPAYENYVFDSVPEGTRLVIEQDVTEDYEECLDDTWPKALEVLKQLCEEQVAD